MTAISLFLGGLETFNFYQIISAISKTIRQNYTTRIKSFFVAREQVRFNLVHDRCLTSSILVTSDGMQPSDKVSIILVSIALGFFGLLGYARVIG